MEADPRAWQGLDARDRVHYGENEQQNWTGHGIEVSGKQPYYPGYPVNSGERLAYYPDHSHALNGDVTSCDPSVYSSAQMVPMTTMTSSHGMYESLPHQHFPAGPSAEMEHWHLQMLSQTDPFIALPIRDGPSKRKRRRVISHEQRKAANIRERRRMYQLNDAFDGLRKRVPTFAYEKKLSRIETLKLAVTYIEFMADILKNNGEKCKELADQAKTKGKDNKRSSLVSEDDSFSTNEDDATSLHSPSQSADEDDTCDKSDDDLEDECKSI